MAATGQTQLFTLEDGLSNKDITCILQTRNGYLWVGTANGLNLYDGYTFREYNRESGLTNAKIKCLYEDANGLLWIGTWEGLTILDQKTGRIKQYFKNKKDVNGTIDYEVTAIEPAASGAVMVGLGDGSLIEFKDENSFTKVFQLPPREKVYKSQITAMRALSDSSLLILNNHGLFIKLDKHFHEDHRFKCDLELVVGIDLSQDKKTLYATRACDGISILSPQTGLPLPGKKNIVLPAVPDRLATTYLAGNKTIWSGFSEGSLIATDVITRVSTNYNSELKRFISGAITFIYQDRKNILWVGSSYGLLKFCPKTRLFQNYLSLNGAEYRSKNSIRGLVEDSKGDIYVGGYNGLFRIDRQDSIIRLFTFNDSKREKHTGFYPYRLLDDSAYIWITSETRGFFCFNKRTGHLEFPVGAFDFFRGYALLNENAESLWVGTHNGLFLFNKRRVTLSKYSDRPGTLNISDIEITDLARDTDGNIWIGSYSSGLFKMNKQHTVVQHLSEASTGLPINFISVLFSESDSIVWAGTRGGGLFRINTTSGKIKVWTKKNGLADNSIAGIEKDDAGILWISTFNGLSKFNMALNSFENYYDKDGLSDNEFNIAAHLKTRNGKIYFGGLNGINAFYPGELKKEQKQPPEIFLTRFVKYDGATNQLEEHSGDLSGLKDIKLTHKDKFFSFYFSLDDYYDPLRATFFYQLAGYDKEWTNIGRQNNIRFNSLPAGDYTLHVKGVNSSGIASANMLSVHLSVSRAFYNSWWFYLLLFLLTATLVFIITRYRIYQTIKIQRLRTKISSDLHDEVGSLLTRITIQAELMKQGISNQNAEEEVTKIADTSRLATAAMSDVLWSIDARNDKVGNLIDRFREHAAEVLSPLETDVDLRIKNIDSEKQIDTLVRQNLFLIFKEAIHNIAKHASATQVTILLENRPDHFAMVIADNGTKKAQLTKQGQGLRNMQMRARLLEGTLDIERHKGYCLTLKIKRL